MGEQSSNLRYLAEAGIGVKHADATLGTKEKHMVLDYSVLEKKLEEPASVYVSKT